MSEIFNEKRDAEIEINMNQLSTPDLWSSVSDEETKTVSLIVILPSGRHVDSSSGHLALISDALYTHEAIVEIEKITRQGGMNGIRIQSMLDIDYYEMYMESKNKPALQTMANPLSPINANLLLLATADINIMTEVLLNQCKSIETYGVGYTTPYESCNILGGKGRRYTDRSSANVGVLALYKIPWAQKKRVAMFCGGIMATGTLAATILLLKYLRGEEKANNNYRANIPLKIVNAELKTYHYSELIDAEKCVPPHKLQNIDQNITIIE